MSILRLWIEATKEVAKENGSTFAVMTIVALSLVGFSHPQAVMANITIPNSLQVDAFGGQLLTDAAVPLLSVLGCSLILMFVLIAKRVIFRKGAALAR